MDALTLTFGEIAENHVDIQKIGEGQLATEGFLMSDIARIRTALETKEASCETIHLGSPGGEPACVLVARRGVDALIGPMGANTMLEEQAALDHDQKAKMYGRVVNKKLRSNLCLDFG